MTQKDNVKQLIGKSLNAYNNKVLQQIDKIEKKNKQQNHKISMLTNELDNDYLTKSEEGSVISLEHSKEGMVYIDSLEGNTLVNYCTDGSKELTLNGDIDLEGTFVTTTEGVDNGLVDVSCEGNTLVNLSPNTFEIGCPNEESTTTFWFSGEYINNSLFKPNTEYSVIFYNKHPEVVRVYFHLGEPRTKDLVNNMAVFTTPSTITTDKDIIHFYTNNNLSKQQIEQSNMKVVILEGDWTNKEIPPYFEGMKSVGQDDENGHKIEILSQSSYPNLIKKSKNLSGNGIGSDTSNHNGVQYLIEDNVEFARVSANKQDFSNFYWWLQTVEPRKKGETYTISYDYRCTSDWSGYWYPSESYNGNFFPSTNGEWRRMKITRTVTSGDAKGDMLFGVEIRGTETGDYIDIKNVKMEKGTNNSKWIPSVMDEEFLLAEYSNKKEILMNEPLRKANDFYRDRLVKIGNKCYIERNTKEVVLDGTHNVVISGTSVKDETLCRFDFTINGLIKGSNGGEDKKFICDKLPYLFIHALAGGSTNVAQECISNHSTNENSLNMVIKKSRLETIDVTGVNKWLSNNNIKIIIPIATPIYEPLEIEPTLNTYTDVTHISNNSLIPCSMKVQNSGYNAIIKPSTLYTVALDTNKSGTIGMNLGGVKGTTTNNVLKLTTPATLTDDSLRLYGKGIKGSKVRLLEGDKTNWIPSHFEGMKSSFEDKFDTTYNTYKMEILSKNRNLLEVEKLIDADNYIKGTYSSIKIPLKPNTRYYYNFDFQPNNIHRWVGVFSEPKSFKGSITKTLVWNEAKDGIKSGYIQTDNSTEYYLSVYQPNVNYHTNDWYKELFTTVCKNFVISEIESEYIDGLSNKIQFSSIEPLRGVGNIKDRFIFKDGKLMIERNIGKHFITKDSVHSYGRANSSVIRVNFNAPNFDTNDVGKIKVLANKYPSGENDKLHGSYVNNVIGITGDKYMRIMLTNLELGISSTTTPTTEHINAWLDRIGGFTVVYQLAEPTYEEVPFELQKIILEGYENGTLFFDTNIPPTSTVTYAGETPIVKSVRLNKTEVLNNTNDINDNIIPYLMDMDYRVVCLQLATEEIEGGVSMSRLFGGAYEMLKRDILSKRLTKEEYSYRLTDYFNAGKLTEQEVRELEDLR